MYGASENITIKNSQVGQGVGYGEYDMKSKKIVNGGWESDFHM